MDLDPPYRPQCRPHPARAGSGIDRSDCRLIVLIEPLLHEDRRHRDHPWAPALGDLQVARSVRCLAGSATIEMTGLPGEVARPTGVGRAGTHSPVRYIPIEGTQEWWTASSETT